MKGTLFTPAGLAEGLAGTGAGEGADREETAEERGREHRPTVPGCAGSPGLLKEGAAASTEHTGRPGQLASPEDTLEQLRRLPKAIWLMRTYLAHQVTSVSARLPQPTLSLPAKHPNSIPQSPLSFCGQLVDIWLENSESPESQKWTLDVRTAPEPSPIAEALAYGQCSALGQHHRARER